MIKDFINNVLIIDDKHEEVEGLENELAKEDIVYQFYTPENLSKKSFHKNRQILFVDLLMSNNQSDWAGNISLIRKLLKSTIENDFGVYGLVLWTKHAENIDYLKRRISEDRKRNAYLAPSFIVGLDKTKYMVDGSYESILTDLNDELVKDKAACFFINWSISVSKAKDKAITDIYNMVPEYEKQKTELSYLFYLLAKNHTGIPDDQASNYNGLSNDAYKAFDEILYSDLINQQKKIGDDLFNKTPQNPWNGDLNVKNLLFAKINSKLFIDTVNINPEIIVPGNIYEIINDEPSNFEVPDGSKKIVIEITPPCDFSQKKKLLSRIIKGFICDLSTRRDYTKECYYKELYPIEYEEKQSQIIFDFRTVNSVPDNDLKDILKYKLLFRVTPKLFADILQKYSSYSARLGLSILH